MDRRLNKPLVIAMVGVALVLGVLLGFATGLADRVLGGPDPKTIASASLESMRAQNRLIAFVARYVSVVSSEQERGDLPAGAVMRVEVNRNADFLPQRLHQQSCGVGLA